MRMIERWFPCAEVSDAVAAWGSGQSEKSLFTWFAARPLAQAKAAVITSLLPWPEDEPAEQERLRDLVIRALTGRDAEHAALVAELARHYPDGASMLDPFSGRAMIPLEAARLGVKARGIDYSPVATLAGQLLADYPLRDWSGEPDLPLPNSRLVQDNRLLCDVGCILEEIGRRYAEAMIPFYPYVDGRQPWGYIWAVTLPCQECHRRFPLTGSLVLRHPLDHAKRERDEGQSYRIVVDWAAGTFEAQVHAGPPEGMPTLVNTIRGGRAVRGKVAVCPFCQYVHNKDVYTRLAAEGQGQDALLVAADLDDRFGKVFRAPTAEEREAVTEAEAALATEPPFAPGVPAVPDEAIPPGNNHTVRPSMYGARTYGDLCNTRQTLAFARLERTICAMGAELVQASVSAEYAAALVGYAASVLVRKLKYSGRGASLQPRRDPKSNRVMVGHIFSNEASIAFSFDYFETALGNGPGTWRSLCDDTLAVLRNQASRPPGQPAFVRLGSALALPIRDETLSAVVTDPPYADMIDYSDASDLFFVHLKRALASTQPEFGFTADPHGVQEKTEEIIIKGGAAAVHDHRTREFYNDRIARAFAEAKRVVRPDGIVTIVFGHGDVEVWHRLLGAIGQAGLVLTGSWPAKTEAGGQAGSANIVTTLTLACRPAPTTRPIGRAADVSAELQREVRARVPLWEQTGLALTDQLMASAGPAMEVVGRYSQVLDLRGEPLDPIAFLIEARRTVADAADIRIDILPLETFDARTRFALFWSRLYGRGVQPKSEARWQALAGDLALDDLRGLLVNVESGTRLAYSREASPEVHPNMSVIDLALALAAASRDGLDAAGDVLARSGRDADDSHLWAALTYLSLRLPEADPDRVAWTGLVRARRGIHVAARETAAVRARNGERQDAARLQPAFDWDAPAHTNGEVH